MLASLEWPRDPASLPSGLPTAGAPKFRNWSTTLESKNDSSAIGQKGRTVRCDIHKRSKETLPSGEPFVPNEDENTKYKKSFFLH